MGKLIKDVFKWLPVECQETRWCKEWKAREQKKDQKQRKLDKDYYDACDERKWDEAKRLFDIGATNDYIDAYNGGITSYICLFSFEKKELRDQLIQKHSEEYEKSTTILLAVQKHYLAEIRKKLRLNWRIQWGSKSTKDLDQVAKDAALWITCWVEEWELAAKWIEQGATNNFVAVGGTTALHWAALKGSPKIVQIILDKFEEEIERKDTSFKTPLCDAFEGRHYDIAEEMIKKKSKYPIMELMLNTNGDIESGLAVINKWTNLEEQLKTDIEFIKTAKLTGNKWIIRHMAKLIEVCTTKYDLSVTKVIQQTFGKTMIVHDELTWRYGKASNSFVASYFKQLKITDDVTLKRMGRVSVNIISRNIIRKF